MIYDKQCSSCGGFCGRGWCKRENAKPQARKPLTDEQIDELDLPPNGCTMRELVRAIERAHGIGEE